MDATQLILEPLVTEKSTAQQSDRNTYSFRVHGAATKPEIKAAIEELYKVKVLDVRTLVRKGKPRRTRTGWTNKSDYKRAIVRLHEDSKIELF